MVAVDSIATVIHLTTEACGTSCTQPCIPLYEYSYHPEDEMCASTICLGPTSGTKLLEGSWLNGNNSLIGRVPASVQQENVYAAGAFM